MTHTPRKSPIALPSAMVVAIALALGPVSPAEAVASPDPVPQDEQPHELTQAQVRDIALNFQKSDKKRSRIVAADGTYLNEYDLGDGNYLTLPIVGERISPRISVRTDRRYMYVRFNQTDQKAIKVGAVSVLGSAICAIGGKWGCALASLITGAGGVYVAQKGICKQKGKKTLQVRISISGRKWTKVACVK